MKHLLNFIKNKLDLEIVAGLIAIIIVTIVHAVNMFNYPYYENDEGIYQSQAWSISALDQLTPYTYWYDHAPAGWMILNLVTRLIGGFYQLNFSGFPALDTGRFVILLFKIISCILIFFTIKNLTKNKYLGVIGILLFGLSPLAVYYQRRILLDNLMITSFLTSLYFLTKENIKLWHISVSAFMFGLSCLIKESAIFFLPGMLFYLILSLQKGRRFVLSTLWFLLSSGTILLYPILAYLKTELFPAENKVSLVGTLFYHTSRGRGIKFWEKDSEFLYNLQIWMSKDNLLIIYFLSTLILSILSMFIFRKVKQIGLFLILLGMLGFVLRGGIVIDFYILPFIPLFAILFVLIMDNYLELMKKGKISFVMISIFFVLVASIVSIQSDVGVKISKRNENENLKKSLKYIQEKIDPNSKFVIDYSHWLDLRKDKQFNDAHYFFKLDVDPAIKENVFNSSWKNIEYVIASHQIYRTIFETPAPILKETMDNSFLLADFRPNDEYTTDHTHNYWSVNGNWSAVFKTNNDPRFLTKLNQTYNSKFISNTGQTIDDQTKFTTSEGQAYTMLRALYSDNQSMFEQAWKWNKDVLQTRKTDKLSSWKYGEYNGEIKVLDREAATDADLDMAFALIKASEKWKKVEFFEEAKIILNDIYELRVKEYNNKLFLLPFTSTASKGFEILNPSYFSPAYYKIFAQVDTKNNWNKLTDDTYEILNTLGQSRELYPDWIKYNITSNTYESAADYLQNPKADNFSFDGMRIFWRIGYDYILNKDQRAWNILEKSSKFIEKTLDKGLLYSGFDPKGEKTVEYETGAMNAMASIPLMLTNSKYTNKVWKDRILMSTNYENGSYNKNNIYYDQNLIWFSYYLNYKHNGLL
ncbi:MAG: glycosyl hydrolase family 8 [Patescibacteria group bacterium]